MIETVKQIKELLKDANTLRTIHKQMADTIMDNPNIDKYGIGFNVNSKFSLFEVTVSYDAYIGHYGSSGCSTFKGLNNSKYIPSLFVEYVRSNEVKILNWIADRLEQEAESMIDKANNELREIKIFLNEIGSDMNRDEKETMNRDEKETI